MATTVSSTISFLSDQAIENASNTLLQSACQQYAPIDVVEICRHLNIDVRTASFTLAPGRDDEVSGLIRRLNGRYQILVNVVHQYERQRYTIAHELGHYTLHRHLVEQGKELVDTIADFYRHGPDDQTNPNRRRAEIQANKFAASLLMPKDLIKEAREVSKSPVQLASMFAVSETAMRFRLAELDL